MNMTMIARTAALASSLETARMDQARRLEELFDAHHQRLYRLARRLSASHDDARDLVQETYLRAAQRLNSVPVGTSSEEAWLVRVLINLCRDRWRQQAVRQRVPASAYAMPTTTPSGEAAAIARSTIWRALQLLSPRRRAVVIMCELEGLSIASVARTLGVTGVTARWHLSRGRKDLARVIGIQGGSKP
jgi:RNA polymerase sigma-70 factor (ECF subfamily)